MRCGNFETSRRQYVASLTAQYSHKFPNSKFEGYGPQAECVALVARDFVSASQPICVMTIMTQLPSLNVGYQSSEGYVFLQSSAFFCSVFFFEMLALDTEDHLEFSVTSFTSPPLNFYTKVPNSN
jgi:hypothetical protein